ncbi:MAG TPA: pre-peptidase C-terminal domain-containing protein, partial [Coleofasciculaceae cyanobacterium]
MNFDLTPQNDVFTIGATVPNGASVRGLNGSDRIFGAARADIIYGNNGGDYILGNAGDDVIYGGRDSDFLAGGQGADQILGQRGNDVLFGGAGNDLLQGNEGDDFLSGDLGIDTLTGGDGADAFALSTLQTATDVASADLITDFNAEAGDLFALTDGSNDNLSEADVKLEASGSDTIIRLASTGAILARVQGVAPAALAGAFSTKKATIDDVEPGANNLGNLGAAVSINNFVGDEDYNDYFRFTVANPAVLEANLTGLAGDSDVDLELYRDADGDGELGTDEIIASSAQSGNAAESISNMLLQPGDYFLAVTPFEGNSNYTLSVAGAAGTPQDLAGSNAAAARSLATSDDTQLNDFVGGSDPSDTYRLAVDIGYLDINTANRTGDVNLQLWRDSNGNGQLDPSEVVAEGTNDISLDGGLVPGDYYLNVKATNAATPYQITALNERGNRAEIENFEPLVPGIDNRGTLDQDDLPDPIDPDNYADAYQL